MAWPEESERHRKAAKGIRTGRKERLGAFAHKEQVIYTNPAGLNPANFPKTPQERLARLEAYEARAVAEGMSHEEAGKFAVFLLKRFPGEPVESYYTKEWIERWQTGHPETYADKETLAALKFAKASKKAV